jgi:translocation and assembly module TamB
MKLIAEGTVTAQGSGTNLSSLFGEAMFKRLGLVIGDYRIDNESDAGFTVKAGRLAVTSMNFTGPGTMITLSGRAKLMAEVDMALRGTADLSLLKLLYHEVEHAAGTASVKMTVKDNWNNPDMAGELRLQNGEVKIKDIPQRFTAMNGKITFLEGKIVTDSLAGEIGGGTLGVSGYVQLSGLALQEFSAKATVDNVTVRYPEGLTSTLSGDLYYDGDASDQSLTGDVTIKRARYDKRIEWKSMLVDIGRGLYQKKKTDVGWIGETQINIRFRGMDSILFQNNLATMPLDVDVLLQGTVNHPQLLGRIEARKGTVYFRKNEFRILHASADFFDPNRMNPVLDIQAETQVREYLIRLAVAGTAERAVVTLISDPPLIDTDILGLLALGKKGSELKGKESGVGVGEAASFVSGQFQDIFERRARSLTGLDRFQIDPYVDKTDTAVPRVTVGKELVQNKLYVTYSSNVGASAPEQIFRIEYILNKSFSLVGGRDEMGSNGADIKYRFEFK